MKVILCSLQQVLIGLVLLTLSTLLSSCMQPVRNSTKSYGKMVEQCVFLGARATAKLYVDEGSNITTSDYYLVTYQDEGITETLIFEAQSSPSVQNLECKEDTLILNRFADDPSFSLSLTWIKANLVKLPLRFRRLKLLSVEYASQVSSWSGIIVPTASP